ncbi:MAG TPA: hypothetical protein VE685_03095 [Thermoanaerobaculia bacterium]|nr:hypothetical protein [Thermoanaerobaculia bacterium]
MILKTDRGQDLTGRPKTWRDRPPLPPAFHLEPGDERQARGDVLLLLAWGNVALHGAALVLTWFGLRPGSALVSLSDRMGYLAGRPSAWTWGWLLWMLCTLLLVAFMAVLRQALPARSAMAQLALVLTAAGMAIDLLCDVIQIQVLPLLAAGGGMRATSFLAFERLAFTGGATAANGLYTAGVLLMTVRLRGRMGAPATLTGAATTVAGAGMALAGLLTSAELLAVFTGPTIGFYSLWTVLVARDLGRRAHPARP